jgi:hypothetical protein
MYVFVDGFAKIDNSVRYYKQEIKKESYASPMNPDVGKILWYISLLW